VQLNCVTVKRFGAKEIAGISAKIIWFPVLVTEDIISVISFSTFSS